VLAQNYGADPVSRFCRRRGSGPIDDQRLDRGADRGPIADLLPPGVIDAATRLVLTNAIYFNAAWLHPFEPV
jgi:serpin B